MERHGSRRAECPQELCLRQGRGGGQDRARQQRHGVAGTARPALVCGIGFIGYVVRVRTVLMRRRGGRSERMIAPLGI